MELEKITAICARLIALANILYLVTCSSFNTALSTGWMEYQLRGQGRQTIPHAIIGMGFYMITNKIKLC